MSEITTYICDICKKTSRIGKEDPIPFCCGKLMTRFSEQDSSLESKSESGTAD